MNKARSCARPRPVVLCILDGWGHREETEDNAIALAHTPNWDRMSARWPHALLTTHGRHVGLPEGQMGNSEVGHMNLGAGRVVMQDLPRIDQAAADGTLASNPALERLVTALKKSGGACHLMGLLSPGGVHSHQDHIAALARVLDKQGVPVLLHLFLDGRDTPPRSALGYLDRFLEAVKDCTRVRIATVSGRYFAMDRDNRWERVRRAHDVITEAEGARAKDARAAIEAAYAEDVSDEFVPPTAIGDYQGMRDGDGLLMANFRADRARELVAALVDPDFDGFERPRTIAFATRVGMTEYSKDLSAHMDVLFPPEALQSILGEVVAKAGMTQLRIAETEKYAHVTFFLNGGEERVFPGEKRILVPSPQVATYDLKPEMSAPEVTDRLVEAIGSGEFDVIIVNYANGDMVGHTGDLNAAIKAVEVVDACLARLEEAIVRAGGVMLVTADHGNCERMRDPETGQAHTAHTVGEVPLVLVGAPAWAAALSDGSLADVAPTMLALMGLEQPREMTGVSLIREAVQERRAAP